MRKKVRIGMIFRQVSKTVGRCLGLKQPVRMQIELQSSLQVNHLGASEK